MRNSRLLKYMFCLAVLFLILCRTTQAQQKEKTAARTVITARTLEYEYKRYVAIFEKDVHIVDPMLDVKAERLVVLFDEEGSIKSATATGAVELFHENSKGSCQKAIYMVKEGEVILLGAVVLSNGDRVATADRADYYVKTGEAKLTGNAVLKRPDDSVRADEVIFQLEKGDIRSVRARGNVSMEHKESGQGSKQIFLPAQ